MKKLTILLFVFCVGGMQSIFAQEHRDEKGNYNKVEVMPSYPGGETELMKFLSENIKYPDEARAEKAEGTVYVKFVVDANGEVADAAIIKGVRKDLDDSALAVVKSMPKWNPGSDKGKNVPVNFTLPIRFQLDK